jgi:hypothetical protein
MAALIESHGSSVRKASDELLPAGCRTSSLRLWGADALFFYRVDGTEHARRVDAGAERLDRFGPLDTLMALPVGVAVPRDAMDPSLRTAVRALPRGAATVDSNAVTRLAVRPIRIELIVVRAPSWRRGLKLASQFAPYSRRAMLLERPRGALDEVLMEAAFYGVGVLVPGEEGLQMVVNPEAYRPERYTPAGWLFVEEMYQRILGAED